jgi:hypothetical protein
LNSFENYCLEFGNIFVVLLLQIKDMRGPKVLFHWIEDYFSENEQASDTGLCEPLV